MVGHVIKRLAHILVDGELVGGDHRCHAPGEEHPRHGDDERLDLQIAHAVPLHQPEHHPDDQHQQAHHRGAQSPVGHAVGQQHAVQGHQGAHGDVDASGEHHAGHAAGHADEARIAAQHVEEGLQVGESPFPIDNAADGIEHKEQNDGDEQQQGVAIHLAFWFSQAHSLHTLATPFCTALAAARFLNQARTGGAWMATITMTTTALNTGATSVETPRLYMVVVMAWMV